MEEERRGSTKAAEQRYTVHELAELSGVSVRTLHYYDEIGLLQPGRRDNNYRSYGSDEVDRLQQILLYREIGMGLATIRDILANPEFDRKAALSGHLDALRTQRNRLDDLIVNVEKTLASEEGGTAMSDGEKFEGLKKKLVDENEKKYGTEIREKYGDEEVDASNAKLMGLTEEQFKQSQAIDAEMKTLLAVAKEGGDPSSEEAQRACDLHRQWLGYFWKEGMYSKQSHLGLGEMYVSDDRFKAHYDSEVPGTAEFFRDALKVYCAQ